MNEDDNKSSVSIRIQYIILQKSGDNSYNSTLLVNWCKTSTLSTNVRPTKLLRVPISAQPAPSVNKFRSTDGNVLIHSKDTKPVGFLQFLTTVLMAEMLRTNLM